jgi:hypothetical protein
VDSSGPFTVYIGWDPREVDAYRVAEHSLRRRASAPVDVVALKLEDLGDILSRPIERLADGRLWCPISQAPMSTEFAISRFSVPFLQREGWALYVDCDVLFQADVAELLEIADERHGVMVVKHEQTKGPSVKMDGQEQVYYERKNWSSVVLWNCSHPSHDRLTGRGPAALGLDIINTWPGRDLHAFRWLTDEEIGSLPRAWNHLVGVDPPREPRPKLLHYTLGGPWFAGCERSDYADLWLAERRAMRSPR